MEKKKPPKKANIDMPDELLSINQVTEFTGVSRDTLIHYDDMGLLKPIRTGDSANNRRLYSKEHLERLKKIMVLRSYGFTVKEVGLILNKEFPNLAEALEERVEELRLKMNQLRNLILFSKFVNVSNSDFIDGLMFGPADIDELANRVRESDYYSEAMDRIKLYSEEEWECLFEELDRIIYSFISLDEDEGFKEITEYIDEFCRWWSENIAPIDQCGFLGFWAIFEDDGVIAYEAEELGGEGTAGFIQMHAFYVWMKRLMVDCSDLLHSIGKYADSDVVCAIEKLDEFKKLAYERMGVALSGAESSEENVENGAETDDLLESILDYMERILDDAELCEYIDPKGEIGMDAKDVCKVHAVFDAIRT